MSSALPSWKDKLRAKISKLGSSKQPPSVSAFNDTKEDAAFASKLEKNKRLRRRIYDAVPRMRLLLFLVGMAWLAILPLERLGRRTYVDEHSIQPAQVTTYWDWGDVHAADKYLGNLEKLWNENATSSAKADFIKTEMTTLGIPTSLQSYSFKHGITSYTGTSTYSIISPPRSSGSETVLLIAPFTSLSSSPNLRGLAQLMAFARFLRGQNWWAKEIIVLWSGEEGVEPFLSKYHGMERRGLVADELDLAPQGVIWQALSIDYPGHSFSHLGIFYEGVNGRLPNQDLINTVTHISRYTGGAPVRLYDLSADLEETPCPMWLPRTACTYLQSDDIKRYWRGIQHLRQHFKYTVSGKGSGAHGVFAKYRIDAITLYAVPATGPHGFHALGIIIESTLRSLNNILERLHASFFFYLFVNPDHYSQVGSYLPVAILLSAVMTLGGLRFWIDAGWELVKDPSDEKGMRRKWNRRSRVLGRAVSMLACCFGIGGALLLALDADRSPFGISPVAIAGFSTPLPMILGPVISRHFGNVRNFKPSELEALQLSSLALLHILVGAVVACLAMVNFPQAVVFALMLLPTMFFALQVIGSSLRTRLTWSIATWISAIFLSPGGFTIWWGMDAEAVWKGLLSDWHLMGSWFLPLAMGVYLPLQIGLCCAVAVGR